MSGLDDLGRALRDDAAANAPRASVIDVEAVTRAARARRRPRLLAVGTLAVVGTLGLSGLAVATFTSPALIAASEAGDTAAISAEESAAEAPLAESAELDAPGGAGSDADDLSGAALPVCGEPAPSALPLVDGLRLEVELPATAPTGSTQVGPEASAEGLMATARIVNTTTEVRTVLTRPTASATLLRDGVVVGAGSIIGDAGLTATLDPGAALDLPVRLVTVSCTDGAPLTPGDYTVLVRVETRAADGGASITLSAIVGPLRIE